MPSRRIERSWMLFDWANQPFYTLIYTFIFAPYFAVTLAEDSVRGQALLGDTAFVAGLAVAILAPVLGAVADEAGPRKPWIAFFSVFFMIGCAGLWIGAPGAALWPVLIFFALAFAASEAMLIFYNAMLPDIGERAELGRISGSGWAMGFAGGVAVLILVLLLLSPAPGSEVTLLGIPPILGLDPAAGEPARATGPLTAIWFLIFSIPLFLYVPDTPRRAALGASVGAGLAKLQATLAGLPKSGRLGRYLLASMLYRDALAGLFLFGGIYAAGVLGWGQFQLGVFGIIAAAVGALGAWVGGRADRRFGPRPAIATSIIVLIVVCTVALTTSRTAVIGMPVSPESSLPDLVFFTCGGLIGAAGGTLQAASRTMLVHVTPARVQMTEAFGLYALSGKATAFLAPFLIARATEATGSQALGVAPVIVLFACGLALLYWVKAADEAVA